MGAEWLDRQSFLGANSSSVIAGARLAVIGLGGGGSHVAQQLGHIGAEDLLFIDPDTIDSEGTNLNRLVGATRNDVLNQKTKVEIARRLVTSINPAANIRCEQKRWQDCAKLLRDRDLIFSCVDGFRERIDIETAARRYLTPLIDIGMDVHELEGRFAIHGQVVLSMPGEPCFRCLGFIGERELAREAAQYGAAGGNPQVVWPNGILASTAIGAFLQIFTPWSSHRLRRLWLEYDGTVGTLVPSPRAPFACECRHFVESSTLGDPWFADENLRSRSA